MTTRDAMAEFYRRRGWNPLPSDPVARKPYVRFKHMWEGPAAEPDVFAKFPSTNVQVMLGRFWRLMVIDLDGPEAIERWDRMPGSKPRTWITHSGGGGRHWWFTLPEGYPHPLRKAVLWKGEGSHSAIERLCDGSLIVAPPSVHHRTGKVYRFLDPWHSHVKLPMPAMVPGWVLTLPDVTPKPVPAALPFVRPEPVVLSPDSAGRYRADDVRAAIPDLIELAKSWGLRFSGRCNGDWMECHAVGREDRNPSAAVNRVTGSYDDRAGASLGFFDLAVVAGGLGSDWREAMAILGERYRARKVGGAA